jgi:hypothetical protein
MTLVEQLEIKKNAERLTIKEIGAILDIPVERINAWIKNRTEPKYSDGIKLINWLKGQKIDNELKEDAIHYKTNNKDLSLQAIVNLTTTNQTLANNSSRLITLLEEKEKSSTASVQQEKFLGVSAANEVLLEVLVEVASGKSYHSPDEAKAAIHKLISDKLKGKTLKGTRND